MKTLPILLMLSCSTFSYAEENEQKNPAECITELVRNNGLCTPAEASIESPGAFLLAEANTLVELKAARNLITTKHTATKDSDVFKLLLESKQYLGCGMTHIIKYSQSQNEYISKCASGLALSICRLADLNEKTNTYLKSILNGEADLRPGTSAEHEAKSQSAYKDTYRTLVKIVGLSTYSALSKESDTIVLTKKQKDAIIAKLKKTFGRKIKKPFDYIDVSASNIVEFLEQKWKLAEN